MNQRPANDHADGARAALGPRGPRFLGKIEKARDPRRTLLRLLEEFKPFRARMTLVLVCIVAYSLLGLAGPWLMGRAIDTFIANRDAAGLAGAALLMAAAYLGSNALTAVANWLMADVSQHALLNLRERLFRRLQVLPIAFFDRNPAGELMSRLTNDIDAINQAVSQNVTALLSSLLSMIGIVVTMFILDAWLAIASLLVVPIMLWFANFVATYTRRGFRDLQKRLGELNAVMEEAISGQKVIKAFGREASVTEHFREHNEHVYRAGVYANSYALLLMPLTAVLGNLFVIVLAGLGGWLALRDRPALTGSGAGYAS